MRRSILVTLIFGLIAEGALLAMSPPDHLDRALTAQKRMTKRRANDPRAFNDLGNLLVLADSLEEAEAAYTHAIGLDPELPTPRYNLALLLHQQGRSRQARRELEHVLKLDPTHAWAHYQTGIMLAERSRNTRAVEHYSLAFELDTGLTQPENNPHLLDNELALRASLTAYRRATARASAPREYQDPKRIASLLIPSTLKGAGEGETDSREERLRRREERRRQRAEKRQQATESSEQP